MPVPGLSLLGLERIRGFLSILRYINPTIIIIKGTQLWATSGPPINIVGYWWWSIGGPIEKLIIDCRQWATEGPSVNFIVSCQWWTTVYQPIMPMASHQLQPISDRLLCSWWASGGPTESRYLGLSWWTNDGPLVATPQALLNSICFDRS